MARATDAGRSRGGAGAPRGRRGGVMSSERAGNEVAVSPTVAGRVDAACDRFEAAFRAGHHPAIEDYLGDAEDSDRPILLRELVALERELRQGLGEHPEPVDYL